MAHLRPAVLQFVAPSCPHYIVEPNVCQRQAKKFADANISSKEVVRRERLFKQRDIIV